MKLRVTRWHAYVFAATKPLRVAPVLEQSRPYYRYDPFDCRINKSVTQYGATAVTYVVYSEQALMGELDKDGKLQRAYGFNPVSGQQGLWSTDPIW